MSRMYRLLNTFSIFVEKANLLFVLFDRPMFLTSINYASLCPVEGPIDLRANFHFICFYLSGGRLSIIFIKSR